MCCYARLKFNGLLLCTSEMQRVAVSKVEVQRFVASTIAAQCVVKCDGGSAGCCRVHLRCNGLLFVRLRCKGLLLSTIDVQSVVICK